MRSIILVCLFSPLILSLQPDPNYDPDYNFVSVPNVTQKQTHTITFSADNKALFHKRVLAVEALNTAFELYVRKF